MSAWRVATPKEEFWLTVFENRVLREVREHRKQEATGEWREMHNVQLRDVCDCTTVRLYGFTRVRL